MSEAAMEITTVLKSMLEHTNKALGFQNHTFRVFSISGNSQDLAQPRFLGVLTSYADHEAT